MSVPILKISPGIAAQRRYELKLDDLDRCLGDIVTDRNFELDVPHMLKSFQAALTVRQGFIDIESPEHKKLQQYVNELEKIIQSEVQS
ncbi:MAG: hypothetical protein KBC53_07195 [Nitrosomonas sp.]|nr:hypothetical protein [Nitrosomonas sp.]MBX9636721.1 hypothetical protein [Nitrosomonas sp.]